MITRMFMVWFALVLGGLAAHATDKGGAAGSVLSLDDCRAIWNLAAGRSDLGRDQAQPYVPDFAAVDVNGDGKITNAEFRAGCETGLVHKARRAD
ncbi:hypothetical protein W911_17370 [Hyphomicrobium nitrativorans NL23]|uniref:EF-hand domain-containing protein n=1 Tax=Hyphomicrobium nitrativorans NL23 TaxID=1029756 RepID=V5SIY8_9HYPH|nr:EF-hand domain-containing protein [Hyphomicrobium nitrativorans]AHB50462.1 hypothetical protein W911_17370 [Hyphomicrobium nitrativorans NL23]